MRRQQTINCMNICFLLFLHFEPLLSYNGQFKNDNHSADSVQIRFPYPSIFNKTDTSQPRIRPNFVFPGETRQSTPSPTVNLMSRVQPFTSDITDHEKTSYYNLTADDYPDLSDAAPRLKDFLHYFNSALQPSVDLSTRTLLDPEADKYIHLCKSEVEIISPRQMKDVTGKFVKVVNYPDNYEQTVRSETCGTDLDQQCAHTDYFPNGEKAICKQNYIIRKLLTIDPKSDPKDPKFLETDTPVPSCCECVVIKT